MLDNNSGENNNKSKVDSASGTPDAGFHSNLGYHQVAWQKDFAEIGLEILPKHLNLAGVIHGGVLTSLLDVVGAAAGTYCTQKGHRRYAITLTLNTTFTGQCSGGTIRAVANCRASGSRIFNSFCEIFDDNGQLLAMAIGTFRLRSGSENPEGVPSPDISTLP